MVNPYKAPESTLQPDSNSNTPSVLKTIFTLILFVPTMYFILYKAVYLIAKELIEAFNLKAQSYDLIFDAIISFSVEFIALVFLYKLKNIYSKFAIVFAISIQFIYWAFESEFVYYGFNTSFPLWYEINLAISQFVAALFATLYNKLTAPTTLASKLTSTH